MRKGNFAATFLRNLFAVCNFYESRRTNAIRLCLLKVAAIATFAQCVKCVANLMRLLLEMGYFTVTLIKKTLYILRQLPSAENNPGMKSVSGFRRVYSKSQLKR